jgi:ElaB/YqjD/DUF883 family membrane-anchored ribosome-binding protein
MAKTAEDSAAEINAELKALREDFAALIATLKEAGTQQAGNVAAGVREAVGQMGEQVRMSAGQARAQGEAMANEMEAMIARNPLTSILVALGLGYLVGVITRR